jgi:hypothetical protein
MSNPLLATEFGQPFRERPARLTGKYIYHPGKEYIGSDGKVNSAMKDTCSLYAVFFKNEGIRLDGTNIMTHPSIVAIAQLSAEQRAGTDGDEFVEFDLPFIYKDAVNMEHGSYMMAIVFSSSFRGDYYEGAPGSALIVDDVKIVIDK